MKMLRSSSLPSSSPLSVPALAAVVRRHHSRLLQRPTAVRPHRRLLPPSPARRCYLSTHSGGSEVAAAAADGDGDGDGDGGEGGSSQPEQQQQPFVQARIQSGEWNLERTDPLYRPKWKSRAKIVSADDFANRPTVGLSGEFESLQDAMVTLSWLDDREQKLIYQLYLELQNHAREKHQRTSHEYVMRVIAQKFNLTPQRVAGVVQLQHNEEQIKKNDPGRRLLTEAAEYMDRAIKQEINDAYQTFKLKKPDEFVEDPVGVVGWKESKEYQVVEDVFDVDQLMEDVLVREEREARLIIDNHVYIEDVDDEDVTIPMSKDAKDLLEAQKRMTTSNNNGRNNNKNNNDDDDDDDDDSNTNNNNNEELPASAETAGEDGNGSASVIPWPATNGDGKTRPRWKYVAQTVNTRDLKKKRAKHRSYTNNNPINTLVEEDGRLREATLADVKQTSWKPVRHVLEHTYAVAKKGFLDKTIRGDDSAWGKAPLPEKKKEAPLPEKKEEAPLPETKKGESGGGDSSSDSEDSSDGSSSDDESSSSGSEEEQGEPGDVDNGNNEGGDDEDGGDETEQDDKDDK